MKTRLLILCAVLSVSIASGQSIDAFEQSEKSDSKPLLDPDRFSVSHSMSFGMSSGFGSSSLQSQSFYSTLMQYRFTAPVTLNLNFSLPIHSTLSPYQNMTGDNMQSLNYFRSMPFDVSLSWRPSEKFQMLFSIVNFPASYYGFYDDGLLPAHRSYFRP